MMRKTARARRAALAVAILAGIAATTGGCGGASGGAGGGGGTLRIGDAASKIDSLNPLVGRNGFAILSFRALYPYLVEYDDQKVHGDFATTWTTSKDGKTITFTTKAGAQWTDGQPVTARDAAWTINTILKFAKGPTAPLAAYVQGVAKATAPSATRLVVRFSQPSSSALAGLVEVPVLPEHVWAPLATGSGAKLATFANTRPVSAGPFTLSTYKPNQFISFTRNPKFYGAAPKASRLGFQFFTSNDAMLSALRSGEIDVAYEVPPTAVTQLKGDRSIAVEDQPGLDVVLLGFNNSSARTAHPELRRPQVRQAIDLALDRSQMVKVVADGSGGTTGSVLPPALKDWYDTSLQAPALDLAKANALLDGLGYKKGADGIRRANGHPMSYSFLYPTVTTGAPRVMTEVVDDVAQLGIKLTARGSDFPSFLQAIYAPKGKYLNWDLFSTDFSFGLEPASYLFSWTCGQLGGNNLAAYCDKGYDNLFARQSTEFGADRVATVKAAERRLAGARAVLPLYVANAISASRRVGNLPQVTATPQVVDNTSKQWLITAALK